MDENRKIPAIEKIMDYVASGIGGVFSPSLKIWSAKKAAEALAIEANSKVTTLNLIDEEIEKARKIGSSDDLEKQIEISVTDSIEMRIKYQEAKRHQNIKDVVQLAIEELVGKTVNDHNVDHDFAARFFNDVQDITSFELKKIWAKILAGEINTPGFTSLHTLAILKNMSQRDAELFENVVQFVMGDIIFRGERYTNNLKEFPSLESIMTLSSYGLINPNTNLSIEKIGRINTDLDMESPSKINIDIYFEIQNVIYFIQGKYESSSVVIPIYRMSPQGVELSNIVKKEINMDYLNLFAKFLEDNSEFELYCCRIIEKQESGYRVNNKIKIEPS